MTTSFPRSLKAAFVGGVAAAAVLACASAALAATTIRVQMPAAGVGDSMKAMAKAYNDSQSDVVVQVELVPPGDTFGQTLLTQLQAGNAADILFTNGGWGAPESIMPLAEAGRLADLAGQPWASSQPQGTFGGYWKDGKLYGLSLSVVNAGMVANLTELKKLGIEVPKTFDEILAACPVAQKAGKSLFGIPGTVPFYTIEAMAVSTVYAADPRWNDKRAAGQVKFATSGWVEAFARLKKMADANCFQPGFAAAGVPQLIGEYMAGNAMIGVGPTDLAAGVKKGKPDYDLKMFALPGKTPTETVAIGFYNDALSVNGASKNLKEALAFVAWLAKEDQRQLYAKVSGSLTPSAAAKGEFGPILEPLAPYYKDGKVREVPHTEWKKGTVRAALNASTGALLAGIKTPEQAAADLDAAWDK